LKSFELRINPISWIIGLLVAIAAFSQLFLLSDLMSAYDMEAREGGFSTMVLSLTIQEVLMITTIVSVGLAIALSAFTHRRILAIAIGLVTSMTIGILDMAIYPVQAEFLPFAAPFAIACIALDWATGFRLYRKLQNITPEAIIQSSSPSPTDTRREPAAPSSVS
jgi:hypothetical protein